MGYLRMLLEAGNLWLSFQLWRLRVLTIIRTQYTSASRRSSISDGVVDPSTPHVALFRSLSNLVLK